MKITDNFRSREFRCRCKDFGFDTDDSWCHGQTWVHRELVVRLQALRDYFNEGLPKKEQRRLHITSGCRCPRYNSEGLVRRGYGKGASESQHLRGTGADIKIDDIPPFEVAKAARDMGFYVIEYPSWTHVDIRQYI